MIQVSILCIGAIHLDGRGRCRHLKFEVVLYRGAGVFSGHPRSRILTHIIHGVALYAGIYGTRILNFLHSKLIN